MTPTEHSPKTPSLRTSFFAVLGGLFSADGTGAAKISPRSIFLILTTTTAVLAFTVTPALAAAPEAPEASVEDSTAVVATPSTEAVLHGTLDPAQVGAPGTFELGEYEFLYKVGATCTGGSVLPTPPGMSLGGGHEELPGESLTKLTPGTKYTVCLQFKTAGGTTLSTPVGFATPVTPETPVTSSPAQAVTATTARLEGFLNPLKAGEPGSYEFLYRVSGTECEGESATPAEPTVGHLNEKVKAAITAATPLQPSATYTFCLAAHNAAGEPSPVGNAVHFTTLAAPATIDSENASNITSSEATLEGSVNPNNQFTECHFQYGAGSITENEVACSPELLKDTYGEQEVSPKMLNSEGQMVPAPVDGLTPGATYHYRIVTKNGKGEEGIGPEQAFDTFEEPVQENATAITSTTAKLNGIVNPHHESEAGSYEFLYKESGSECQLTPAEAAQAEREAKEVIEQEKPKVLTFPQRRAPKPAAATTGASPQQASVEVTGLRPGAVYSYCLVVNNSSGKRAAIGSPVQFTAASAAPAIETSSSLNETAAAAELHATINPDGAAISYHFEYDTTPYEENEAGHGASTPVEEIPAGASGVPVSAEISGLHENNEYYWRVVASNTEGTTTSVDHTFFYSTTTTSELPDHRAYEMVTPPFKNGASPLFAFENHISPAVAASGSAVMTMAVQCYAGAESCTAFRDGVGEPFGFRRTAGGWTTVPLAPPAREFSENTAWVAGAEGSALFSMPTGSHGEEEWYKREESGLFTAIGPLTPEGATGTSALQFGGQIAVTADLSHLVWSTLTIEGGRWPFDDTPIENANAESTYSVYEYVGTHGKEPLMVGVSGGEGSKSLVSECGVTLNALSADGRTVYFSTQCGGLYARVDGETTEAHTDTLSSAGANFVGASEDGHTAFFIEGEGLYESLCTAYCEGSGDHEIDEGREVIDVSAGSSKPEVLGVTAISADGSHVYFVANGVLAPGATPGTCHVAHSEAEEAALRCNLYVYERDARYPQGHLAFIASLPGIDRGESWAGPQARLANVTPDGRFLVFQSNGNLTSDAHAGEGQVYRYDAETGQLVRVSIGNDGFDDDGNAAAAPATIAPAEAQLARHPGPSRQDPTMSDNGEYVFFESPAALTPHALNDVVVGHTSVKFGADPIYAVNVYEWHEGHVYLISDGRDVTDVKTPCEPRSAKTSTWGDRPVTESATCLLGADSSGDNVFFMTTDSLVPKDTDTQIDIYDARICEPEIGNPCITEPSPPLPPCNEEACHGTPAATPSLLAPGTASFNGEGNITPAPPPPAVNFKSLTRAQKLADALHVCRKDKKKSKRHGCESDARKQYGATARAKRSSAGRESASRATTDRRNK